MTRLLDIFNGNLPDPGWAKNGPRVEPSQSQIDSGWRVGQQPSAQVQNWLEWTRDTKLNLLLSTLPVPFNATTPYFVGSLCLSSGAIFACRVDGSLGHQPPHADWVPLWSFISNPILASYTVAGLPSPATYPHAVVFVSDGSSNRRVAVSDGANWRFGDGAIVS